MNLDWLTTLGVADQSLEAQLAKRDLSKKAALVQSLAKTQEDFRQNRAQEDFRNRQLEENTLLRKATQDYAEAQRQWMRQEASKRDRLSQYNTTSDNLQRQVAGGQAPVLGDEQAQLMTEFEGPTAITDRQVAGSPPGEGDDSEIRIEHVYRQQEAEAAALKAKHEEQRRETEQKNRLRDQQIQERELQLREKANQRAEAEEARRQQREKDRQVAVQDRRKALEANLKKLPPQLSPAVKARAEQIISENSSIWDMLPWADKEENITDAWVKAYNETVEKVHPGVVKDAPLGPGTAIPPSGGGRGAGPQPVASPAAKDPTTEAIEKALGHSLPPGAKVRRIQ